MEKLLTFCCIAAVGFLTVGMTSAHALSDHQTSAISGAVVCECKAPEREDCTTIGIDGCTGERDKCTVESGSLTCDTGAGDPCTNSCALGSICQ